MTAWFSAWALLVIATTWLFILGMVRLLASRQITGTERGAPPRSLVLGTLVLAGVSAAALVFVSVVLLTW